MEWINVRRCPVCDSPSGYHSHFARIKDEGFSIAYLICVICGLVFQSPRLSLWAWNRYYAKLYHQNKMPSPHDIDRNRWVQQQRGRYLTKLALDLGLNVRSHLDIGASRGLVMKAFKQEFSCESHGIEPGEKLRQDLANEGLSSFADVDHLPEQLQGTFDLITMTHTLEHLAEPRDFLEKLHQKWLRASGMVFIEVPNLIWHPALEFSHLTAFTETSLRGLASQSGFYLQRLSHHGQPYSRRLPLFLLAAFGESNGNEGELRPVPSIFWISLRRWLGTRIYRFIQWANSLLHPHDRMRPWSN